MRCAEQLGRRGGHIHRLHALGLEGKVVAGLEQGGIEEALREFVGQADAAMGRAAARHRAAVQRDRDAHTEMACAMVIDNIVLAGWAILMPTAHWTDVLDTAKLN